MTMTLRQKQPMLAMCRTNIKFPTLQPGQVWGQHVGNFIYSGKFAAYVLWKEREESRRVWLNDLQLGYVPN